MMKSFSKLVFSAIAAGAVAAVGLQCLPHSHQSVCVTPSQRHPVSTARTSIIGAGKVNAMAAARDHFAALDAVPASNFDPRSAGAHTILLSQPVTVLKQSTASWVSLPRGTGVRLLAVEGNFVRVSHAGEEVVVPVNALLAGISSHTR